MKKIIIDTNFMMIPFSLKVDIFSEFHRIISGEYKLYLIDKTVEELKKLSVIERGKAKQSAKFALEILSKKKIEVIPTEDNGYADSAILNLAEKEDYIVATQDMALKRKLRQFNRQTISLRQKKYLVIV